MRTMVEGRHRPRLAASLAGLGLLMGLGIGCGYSDGLGTRYSVTGTVTYKGQPVEKGNISFIPVGGSENARGAGGEIANGRYSLSTMGNDDGAFPGKYQVTVVALDVDLSPYMKHGGIPDQVNVAKAEAKRSGWSRPSTSCPSNPA